MDLVEFMMELDIIVLSGPEKYVTIYNRIRYLLIQKTLTLHNVIILIKSVLYKKQSHYYYNKFLYQCSYQLINKFLYKL